MQTDCRCKRTEALDWRPTGARLWGTNPQGRFPWAVAIPVLYRQLHALHFDKQFVAELLVALQQVQLR